MLLIPNSFELSILSPPCIYEYYAKKYIKGIISYISIIVY
ncbi:hypothetical protein CBC_0221 [Clostridium botulinum C str. Eklund]|nr:hypothetical protein CBC_0221 [Clostridium botulinum C str. Eklund]